MSDDTPDDTINVSVDSLGSDAALTKAEQTTQLAERRIETSGYGIQPPYDPDRLAAFLELNETHAASVRTKARYEVGFGFGIVPHQDVDADDADDLQRAAIRDFWRGRNSKWQTGPDRSAEPATPEEVKELARQDYHSIGWCCLEVLTNAEGVPVGLAYVPANTVRVRKPQEAFDQPRHPEGGQFIDSDEARYASRGYVQRRRGERRYFGEAGDRYRGLDPTITGSEDDPTVTYATDDSDEEPIFVDRETGDVALGSAELLDNEPANELIFIRNPSPLEQDYGIPDWISALRTIVADEAAKDYNRAFFDNDTIPRFVIKVTGGELSEESKRDLKQMLHGLREESHRTVVLEVEKFQEAHQDVEIELEPLSQGISEEMSFEAFRTKNEHDIAKAHEVPPIKIGVTESSNRSNSAVQDRQFAIETIQPEQHKFATRLYRILHQQAFGVTDWTLEYELRGADQPKEDATIARQKIQAVRGAIPIDRALEMIGEDPLPDDHPISGDTLVADVGQDTTPDGPEGEDEVEASRPPYLPPQDAKLGEREWDDVKAELVEKDPIETEQFSSSNLDEGLFDFGENTLFLSFKREGANSLYAYVDVPTGEWAGLVNAASHGSYHYANIRLDYAYVEVTNFHERLPEGPAPDAEDIPEGVPDQL